MNHDELINIWQEGSDQMFGEQKTDKKMITQYLNEKTLKGTRSISFNIIFYGAIQITNLIFLSMNLAGYMNNSTVIWLLIPQILMTIGILIFGMDLFYKLREINNYSDSLQSLLNKQLRFFRKPYELWLVLSSVSALILATNLNMYIDNVDGTYTINNKVMYAGISLALLLLIYGAQKLSSLNSLRSVKAYLSDLQSGVLDESKELVRSKRRLVWIYVILFIILTATMVAGLIVALR
jgi:hypothetical protein